MKQIVEGDQIEKYANMVTTFSTLIDILLVAHVYLQSRVVKWKHVQKRHMQIDMSANMHAIMLVKSF